MKPVRVRPCPSNNPGCVSSNLKSWSFAFPWRVLDKSLGNALQEAVLEELKLRRMPKLR
ncbi:putative thylakoid lumenal 17.9kDa protein [Helianthus annuus]|uniref:Thylakoid lumenal 17.9kDa protein n=1 Tax=Helianthus annuus TaxID=4232 RepID=A0A9K3I937_HELAN|nr:putative thylakoid lumenal 17.9kDa protein [Helianthus annuus]